MAGGKGCTQRSNEMGHGVSISRTGRRPWAQPWYWETLKSRSGHDAQKPRTVLVHVLNCWDHWLTVTHRPKKGDRRYAIALVLVQRVLRGWRHWTAWKKFLAPHVAAGSAQCTIAPPSSHAISLDFPEDFAHYLRVTGGLLQHRRRMGQEGSTCNLALRRIPVATYKSTRNRRN
jgi:hypothetical protein